MFPKSEPTDAVGVSHVTHIVWHRLCDLGPKKNLSKHTWQSGCGDANDAWQESPSISKYLLFLYVIGFPGVAVFTTSNMLTIPPCVHSKARS